MAAPAACILRGGVLVLSCCCKSLSLRYPRIFAGCFPTFSEGHRMEMALVPSFYPFHMRKAGIRSAQSISFSSQSFFNTSSEADPIVDTSSESDDKLSSSVPTVDSAGPAASINDAARALDIRVGRILRAWRHLEADALYVEEVDVGEPEPRIICSGLVNYIPLDDLQGRNVIVLANLKPRNMRGVKSSGMLLAASDAGHDNVELLLPPEGSVPGERIRFGLEEGKHNEVSVATPNQVHKKKIWESVQPHLKTDNSCVAVLGGHPMRTSAGLVKCRSLRNANIS